MSQTVIEKIEQTFNGTVEELKKLIDDYIYDHVPRGVFVGESLFLELEPSLTDPWLFFVVRSKTEIVQIEKSNLKFDPIKKNKKIKLRFDPTKEIEKNEFMFGPTEEGEVLVFDPNPPREGEIRLREITKQTPRTKFICLAYTVECSRFGRSLASEIGPASAMTKQANTQEEKRIKKILEYLYREDDETKEFVERYLGGENAESIRKFYFYKRVNSVYLKYKRLKKRYPNAPWPPNRYEKG